MTKQERALKSLVMDIHKAAKKQPRIDLWYPGYYPGGSYFVCDGVRILKCFYSEEFPLPSPSENGVKELDYQRIFDRNLVNGYARHGGSLRVKLPTLEDLKSAQLSFDAIKPTLPGGYDCKRMKQKRAKALWHFGGDGNYFNVDYIAKAIPALKEPKAYIASNCIWSLLYIVSEPEGTELLISPVRVGEINVKLFYRCDKLEVYEDQP